MSRDEQNMAAAEEVYRAAFAERVRNLTSTSERESSPEMKRTMTGEYLDLAEAERTADIYAKHPAQLVGVTVGAGSDTKLPVTACQDFREARVFDRTTDKDVSVQDSGLFVERVLVVKQDGTWKVAKLVESTELSPAKWKAQICAAEVGG